MKSKSSYEMHNYVSIISPNASLSDALSNNNINITTSISSKIKRAKATMKQSSISNEKYSLRQRQKRRNSPALPIATDSPGYASDENNNNNHSNNNEEEDYVLTTFYAQKTTTPTKTKNSGKRKKFDNSSHAYTTPALTTALATQSKNKTKAAPLSKYRRKTANARERTRMREINSAFENLRHCVPHTITGDDAAQSNEKLTKITTLRLAMKYISILSEALANPTFGEDFVEECKRDGDNRFTEQPLLPYVPPQYDEVEIKSTPLAKKSKSHAKAKATKSNATAARTMTAKKCASDSKAFSAKRQTKKQKMQPYADAYSSAASTCSSHSSSSASVSSSSSSAYATLSSLSAASSIAGGSPNASSAFLLDSPVSAAYMHNMVSVHQSMSDLSSLMLESDGESMQLSEPCLSPLQSSYHLLGGTSQQSSATTANSVVTSAAALSPFDTSAEEHIALTTLENPLELSLRLLDSSADSLDFNVSNSDHHVPSTCISPLVTLDSFNPFADLLHSDFSEQSTLDLFLA